MTRRRALTFIELMISMTILAILAAAVMPTTQKMVKRRKEMELRRVLLEMRDAIDRFKRAHEEGLIQVRDVDQHGYPADFDELVEGVPLKKDNTKKIRFLRKIPIDPMTGEAEWGMRSVQDDPDDGAWGGQNLFDVFSRSDGLALDGTEYAEW